MIDSYLDDIDVWEAHRVLNVCFKASDQVKNACLFLNRATSYQLTTQINSLISNHNSF